MCRVFGGTNHYKENEGGNLSNCNVDHDQLHKRTDALAAEMGMQINVTRQEVFDAMHTI